MTTPPAALPADWMLRPEYRAAAEELFDVSVREVDPDRALVAQAGGPGTRWSLGRWGVLADAAGGRPLAARLGPGLRCSTVAMHLDLVRPHSEADGPLLTATGEPLDGRTDWTLCRITVSGAAPGPLAVGTARFLVVPDPIGPTGPPPGGPGPPSRPVQGARTGDDDLATLLELRAGPVTDGRAEFTFHPGARHSNPFDIVHGGINVALVDAAMTAAAGPPGAGAPEAPPLALLGVDLVFHRPIPVGGVPVSVTAEVLHRGRTVVLAEATVRAANGKPLTTARGTLGRIGPR